MWLQTKTDSELDVLINLDHVTHIFANPYGSLIVLNGGGQAGVKDTLPDLTTAIREGRGTVLETIQ